MSSNAELLEKIRKLKAQIAEKKEENKKKDLIISDLKARLAKKRRNKGKRKKNRRASFS